LQRVLPPKGLVLEIAAGTGEHSIFFSAALPHLVWQPTDAKTSNLASINAWAAAMRAEGQTLEGLRTARTLDTTDLPWMFHQAQAILCINMIHISPWAATQGLMKGAGQILRPGGVLYTYGPYLIDGKHTAESNAKFDLWLKGTDPRFAIRDSADVAAEAARNGLELSEIIPMPANNFSLVFHKK
jgi:SAM-dependent methyltransferase